ncbi:1905_t:CDS:1 [Ambispora leptoticha]|uniref:1905_t:CDS:1 n=1 Tax=Ambispora leptoticha TaxID=144679 RepID=A0A9N9BJC7_9GLOM|nr:1905_t:CDS:1 [Ambispora leptoticha]
MVMFVFTTLFKYFLEEVATETAVVVTAATVGATATYVTYRAVDSLGTSSSPSSSYVPSSSRGCCDSPTYSGELKTIWDWWGNGLSGEERQRLLDLGYNDRSGCFKLDELKGMLRLEEKAPGKPTKEDGFEPKKGWDGKTLERAPKSYHKKGYPDDKGRVWVPTGENTDNVKQHGNPHWDRVYPDGSHDNVYPGGDVRSGSN